MHLRPDLLQVSLQNSRTPQCEAEKPNDAPDERMQAERVRTLALSRVFGQAAGEEIVEFRTPVAAVRQRWRGSMRNVHHRCKLVAVPTEGARSVLKVVSHATPRHGHPDLIGVSQASGMQMADGWFRFGRRKTLSFVRSLPENNTSSRAGSDFAKTPTKKKYEEKKENETTRLSTD